jgi:hypothetical protein
VSVESIYENPEWQIPLELRRATGKHQSLTFAPADRAKQGGLADTRLSDDLDDARGPIALDGAQRTLDRLKLTDTTHEPRLRRCRQLH